MCGRNVLQIGMYLSVELWVEAIFLYTKSSSIMLFICLFVVIDIFFPFFVGQQPQLFTSFVLIFLFILFPVDAAILKNPSPNLQMSRLQSLSWTLQCQK